MRIVDTCLHIERNAIIGTTDCDASAVADRECSGHTNAGTSEHGHDGRFRRHDHQS